MGYRYTLWVDITVSSPQNGQTASLFVITMPLCANFGYKGIPFYVKSQSFPNRLLHLDYLLKTSAFPVFDQLEEVDASGLIGQIDGVVFFC